MQTAKDILKKVKPERKTYNRVEYLLSSYKDLKKGNAFGESSRDAIELIENAFSLIADDEYADIIKAFYFDGKSIDEISRNSGIDERTIYRHKKRLIQRLAVILYGDEALTE